LAVVNAKRVSVILIKSWIYMPEFNEDNIIRLTINSYNKSANNFADYYYSNYSKDKFSSIKLGLFKFCKRLSKKGLVLDLGCGPGIHSNFISQNGLRVFGVDLSEGMIKHAKTYFPDINFARMNVLNLGFKDSSFNGIWSSCLIHHIPKNKIIFLFHELYRIAKNNCIIYLITKSGVNETIEETHLDKLYIGPRYLVGLQEDELKKMIILSGFKLLTLKIDNDDFIHLMAQK
jgi:SAM-dependent methyltransferase